MSVSTRKSGVQKDSPKPKGVGGNNMARKKSSFVDKKACTNTSAVEQKKFFICLKCDVGIEDEQGQASIRCHDCKQWAHKECTSLTDRDFSYLEGAEKGIEWICEKCCDGEGERKTEVEAKIDRLIKLFEMANERLERLEEGCGGKALDEKIENAVEKKVTELWEEKVEKEKREMNLIFTNIPESSGENREERMKEDLNKIQNLVEKICPELDKETVKEPVRLGNFNLGARPRLIKLRVKSIEAKKEILKNARKLNKEVNDQKDKVYINPDYTETERRRNKDLREELRQRIQKGEKNIGIRGGKITNVQWRPRLNQGEGQ